MRLTRSRCVSRSVSSSVSRSVGAALAVASLALLTACSSGSSNTSAAAAGGGDAASQTALKTAYTGLAGTLPTESATPKSGVDIWIVSCGQAVTTCSTTAGGAETAAKSIGWDVHLCDGQLNPGGWSSCIRQAVAAKADVIDVIAIDCPPVKQALVEAQQAGIVTIGGGGFDCSELGGDQTYTGTVQYQPDMSNHEWWAELGKLQADWVIGATGGQAKVLSLKFTDEAWGEDIQNAFAKELATCSGCSIVKTQEMGNGDVVGGTLRTKFSTALLQSPTANAVNLPIDGWMSAGLAQAVTSSGRAAKLHVIGAIGEAPNMEYIRTDGGENATAAFAGENTGWASIDVAIRVLDGQKGDNGFFPEGISIQVVDKTTNLPPAGQGYVPPTDYAAAYAKLWGTP